MDTIQQNKYLNNSNNMKLLEFFSGAGSVGMVARDLGYSVISLDLKNADINQDILSWNYKEFDVDDFDDLVISSVHRIQHSEDEGCPKD